MIYRFILSAMAFLVGLVSLNVLAEGASFTWSYASSLTYGTKQSATSALSSASTVPASSGTALAVNQIPIFGANVSKLRYQSNPTLVAIVADTESAYANEEGLSLAISAKPSTVGEAPTSDSTDWVEPQTGAVELEIEFEPEVPYSFVFVTWRFFAAVSSDSGQDARPSTFSIDVEDFETRRNLVSISSDDPRMFPISQVLAAGTGFDIYEKKVEATSNQQTLTLPAANMTGMRTTGFLIEGADRVRMSFSIDHGNSHPAGSMALVDRIEFTSMLPPQLHRGGSDCVTFQENCANLFPVPGSFFDPDFPERPPRFCELQPDNEGQSVDLRQPQEFRGTVMATVIADGEIRIPLGGFIGGVPRQEFEISFLEGNAPEDGGFGEFGSFDRLPSVTVPTFPYQGLTVGMAQFRVPDTFVTESLDLETDFGPSRQVRVRFCFQNPGGKDRVCTVPPAIAIRRPPVVLIHGLWSEAATWTEFDLRTSEYIDVRIADYSASNASSIAENRDVPAHMLFNLCTQYQNQSWFFTQADVIGHSMGGLLARDYLAKGAPFTTINRLYTLNTPHTGSPLANLLISIREHPEPAVGPAFSLAMANFGMPINLGAIDSLAVGSLELASLPTTRVLSHALAGIGGSAFQGNQLILAPGRMGQLYSLAAAIVDLDTLFKGLQHDLVVGRQSQIGGLPLGTYSIFEGFNSIHTRVTSSTDYSERILCPGYAPSSNGSCVRGSGLASGSGTGEFAFFPSPSSVLINTETVTTPFGTEDQKDLIKDGVVILSPTDGDVFQSGESVVVTAESVAPFQAEHVMLGSRFDIAEMTGSPLTSTFDIPLEFVGRFGISTFARDEEGNFTVSSIIELKVESPAELISLSVEPSQLFLRGPDYEPQIIVRGQFADGVERHLESSSTGTTYASSDPSVAEVTSEGRVIPRGVGTAMIVVQNGDAMDSLTIEVLEFELTDIFWDRFETLAGAFELLGFLRAEQVSRD